MRFERHLKLEYGLKHIGIVPLINVILLVFVFFMLSPFFTTASGINVKFPKAVTSDIIKEENVVITITSENIVYLNEKVATLKELKGYLNNIKNPHRSILIRSDRRASVGRIVDIWDLCRSLGIENINIATNQEN